MKKYIMILLGIVPMFMFAQNITDQAVMNDKSADIYSYQEDNLSTVDDSIFLYQAQLSQNYEFTESASAFSQ